MFHSKKNAIKINGLLFLPICQRHLDNTATNRDTRIVQQNIQSTMSRFCHFNHVLPLKFIGNIVQQKFSLPAGPVDRRGGFFSHIFLYICDHNNSTLLSQTFSTSTTYA